MDAKGDNWCHPAEATPWRSTAWSHDEHKLSVRRDLLTAHHVLGTCTLHCRLPDGTCSTHRRELLRTGAEAASLLHRYACLSLLLCPHAYKYPQVHRPKGTRGGTMEALHHVCDAISVVVARTRNRGPAPWSHRAERATGAHLQEPRHIALPPPPPIQWGPGGGGAQGPHRRGGVYYYISRRRGHQSCRLQLQPGS